MKPVSSRILTIIGGSSSIKFALFEAGEPLRRSLDGSIERTRPPDATLSNQRFKTIFSCVGRTEPDGNSELPCKLP